MKEIVLNLFYVAKIYKHANPLIVESFENIDDAWEYAALMNRTGKGIYTVLSVQESL